jgi:iron complex outermembrane recepter protein
MGITQVKRAAMLAVTATALPFVTGPAFAESSSAPAMEEIIVSVRYKDESLQEVPAAVSAYNQEILEKIIAMDLRDVGPATPNVNIQQVNQFPNAVAMHVRGIGFQGIESTEEPRVGVSVDGIFFTRPVASNIDLFDVASIEIIRGPTGVTFGKNSLSGGLQVETIRPSGEAGAKVSANIGDYGRRDYKFSVDSPMVGDWAFRFSYLDQNYDGHFKNRFDGLLRANGFGGDLGVRFPVDRELGAEDVRAGRLQALWTPSDEVDLRLIYNFVKDESDATPGDLASDPGQLSCILLMACPEPDNDPYTIGRDYPSQYDNDQEGFTAILNWDLGNVGLTAIAGYVSDDEYYVNDFDQTEYTFFPTSRDQVHDQKSLEVRLASTQDDLAYEWVVGAFYMQQEHELTQNFPTLGSTSDYTTQDATSKAVFGQLIYHLSEQLNLTLGVRYSDESKDFYRDPNFLSGAGLDVSTHLSISQARAIAKSSPLTLGGAPDINGSLDTDNVDYKLGLDYRVNDNMMVYAQYATGFKAGEFGARANSALTARPTGDESADSFEVGLKSEWWDNRLRANVTVFRGTFEDLQFGIFAPSTNATGQETINSNIGEATSQGVEFEISAYLTDQFSINGNLSFLDVEYDKFCADLDGPSAYTGMPTSACGAVNALPNGTYLVDDDYSSLELSRAPDSKLHINAEYNQPLDGMGSIIARVAYTYTDEYFSDGAINHPAGKTGDFGLWDASLGWESEAGNMRVVMWGKNLSDENEVAGLTPTANFFNQRFWFAPRTYGVEFSYIFGQM